MDRYEVFPAGHWQTIKDAIHVYNGFMLASEKMDECCRVLLKSVKDEIDRLEINIQYDDHISEGLELILAHLRNLIISASVVVELAESSTDKEKQMFIDYRIRVLNLLLQD